MELVTLIVVVVILAALVMLVSLCGKVNLALWRITEMEKNMSLKVSEIKTAVAALTKNNREAFIEVGNLIAGLKKQIDDLISGVGDPTVTDEAFEADLKAAGESAQALADIVPGAPEPPA